MAETTRDSVLNEDFDFRIHRYETVPLMKRAHRHHEVEINYLEVGEATYLIGGRLTRVPAGRFSFFWGSIPHQLMQTRSKTRGFWYVTVPLAWVLAWGLPPRLLGRLLDGELLRDRAARPADAGRFVEWQQLIHRRDACREKPAMLELEARFRRFAIDNPAARREAKLHEGSIATHGQLERLARFIVEHFHKPITLADIAAAANIHPNYAANLFRRHCGQTLLQCVNQHRIAHAQRLLATGDAKVIDVALQSGFGSLSRFYEAFERSCATTPAAYRKRFYR